MSKKILTPDDLRKIAERIDEEENAEKENAHERDRLKTEAARLKVEKIRAEYERERLKHEREHARNASNADERESRRRFIVALFYGGIVAAFLIWSIIIVTRYF